MAAVAAPRPLLECDDRARFDCGRDPINAWFRRHAWANHSGGTSRVSVIADSDGGAVIGYVTLSASRVERAFLAKALQRNQPDPLPVTLLGQLAVDKKHQRLGHAASLLLFAFRTALLASRSVGSAAIITHPLDDGARAFYRRWGFADLPFDPRRAMAARMVDVAKSFDRTFP